MSNLQLLVPRSELAGLQQLAKFVRSARKPDWWGSHELTERQRGVELLFEALIAAKAVEHHDGLIERNDRLNKHLLGIQVAAMLIKGPRLESQGILEHTLRKHRVLMDDVMIPLEDKYPGEHAVVMLNNFEQLFKTTTISEIAYLRTMRLQNNKIVDKIASIGEMIKSISTEKIVRASQFLTDVASTKIPGQTRDTLSKIVSGLATLQENLNRMRISDIAEASTNARQLVDVTDHALRLTYPNPSAPSHKRSSWASNVIEWQKKIGVLVKTEPNVNLPIITKLTLRGATILYSGIENLTYLRGLAKEREKDITSGTTESLANVTRALSALISAVTAFKVLKTPARSPVIQELLMPFATAIINIEYVAMWEYFHGFQIDPADLIYSLDDRKYLQKAWIDTTGWNDAIKDQVKEAYDLN